MILESYSKLHTGQTKYICMYIQRFEVSLFISIPAGRIKRKLFHSMLPELTSWHIVRYAKRCFIYYFAKRNS